jgi:hypothetical protein
MPTGWATVADDDDSGPPCDAGLSGVLGIDEDDLSQGEFIAAEDEDLGPLLGNFVTVLPPDAPSDVMTEWRNRMLACNDEVDGLDASCSELSLPVIGDETIAVRLNLANDDMTGHFDMLAIRSDVIVVALQAYEQFGDSTALLTQYGQLALDRATSALR